MKILTSLLVLLSLTSAFTHAADPQVLRIINWGEYISPDVIADFEKTYNAKVEYTGYYSLEEFASLYFDPETQYDVVFPASRIIPKLTELQMLQPLDLKQLPRFDQLRADVLRQYQQQESGTPHGVPYMWGTTGLGVNVGQLEKQGIAEYKDSWALLFDPEVRSKAAQCGIALLNERDELFAAALTYLGHSVNTTEKEALAAAGRLLRESLSDAKYLHANQHRQDLANGRICVAVGYSGNILFDISGLDDYAYFIPREGAAMWIDVMAVDKKSPQKALAYQFIDFLMQAPNAAINTNLMSFPTAMASAEPLIDSAIIDNQAIYPSQARLSQLEALMPMPKKTARMKHKLWVSAICSGRSWCSVPMSSYF